jgi:hypothetical protein
MSPKGSPSNVAATSTVEIRGQRFVFRELEIGEYDELIKKASREEADADGVMQEVTDNTLLLRLMVLKSCTEPKLTSEILNSYGTRLFRAMARVVNELHYDPEPVKRLDVDDAAEETPKGNE